MPLTDHARDLLVDQHSCAAAGRKMHLIVEPILGLRASVIGWRNVGDRVRRAVAHDNRNTSALGARHPGVTRKAETQVLSIWRRPSVLWMGTLTGRGPAFATLAVFLTACSLVRPSLRRPRGILRNPFVSLLHDVESLCLTHLATSMSG